MKNKDLKLLIFHSENGQNCNSNFLIEKTSEVDTATLKYLSNIGDFAWDVSTATLQTKVKNKEAEGLYKNLRKLIDEGYNCFSLDDTYSVSLTRFN